MKNYLTENILEYRYKTNAYIALLCESRYFDPNISDVCRSEILENITQLSDIVCEDRKNYPYALVKKRTLAEQAPPISRSVGNAFKAIEAARIAKEAKAAAEAAEAAKAAAKAAEAAKPARQPILPAQSAVQPTTPIRGKALGAQALDYIQMQALTHAQQGLRGEDLANVVRETLKNNPKFAELGSEAEKIEKASEYILKSAEETATAVAKGERPSVGAPIEWGKSPLAPEETGLPREDILTFGAALRGERSKLKQAQDIAFDKSFTEPKAIDWSGSWGMTPEEISQTIGSTEARAAKQREAGREALSKIAPESEAVANKLKDLVYELNRRKAQGEIFTDEEITAYKKIMDDLKRYEDYYVDPNKVSSEPVLPTEHLDPSRRAKR